MEHLSSIMKDVSQKLKTVEGSRVQTLPGLPTEEVPTATRPLTVPGKARGICPTCKNELSRPHEHGWMKEYRPHSDHAGHLQRTGFCLVPCPTCAPTATTTRKAEIVEHLLGKSHIPIYARSWSFQSTPKDIDRAAILKSISFADGQRPKQGLLLFGPPGTGKTGLAISIIQAVLRRGEDGAFIRSIDLMNRLREAIATGSHDGDDLLELIRSVQWLALDDLATERPTPYVIEQLYALVETRRSAGLRTIVTCNFTLDELEEHWRPRDGKGVPIPGFHPGQRVKERLAEYCEGVRLNNRNVRQAKG